MKNWFEHDGDKHASRNFVRDRLLIAAAVVLVAAIALVPALA